MNVNDKIIMAFNHAVNANYHHLKSDHLYVLPVKRQLEQMLLRMTSKKEKAYPSGQIHFNTPQGALKICNSEEPMFYMDKLILLAAFAKCMNQSFELTHKRVSPNHVVTYLKIVDPMNINVPYYLCPGRPFNQHP